MTGKSSTKPVQHHFSPPKSDMSFKEEPGEEIEFIEESLGEEIPAADRDMLASGSNDNIRIQHVKERDPEGEKVKKRIEEQLDSIAPKFDDSYQRKEDGGTIKRVTRPSTSKVTKPTATAN